MGMKNVVSIVFFILVGLQAGALPSRSPAGLGACGSNTALGGVVVWPFGREILFPWSGIQGIWQVADVSCGKLYIFKALPISSPTEKQLIVTEYDPVLCRVTATGRGIEKKRIVTAFMAGQSGPFELTIHAFNQNDVKFQYNNGVVIRGNASPSPVFVMRTFPVGSRPDAKTTYRIKQLDRNPSMVCK